MVKVSCLGFLHAAICMMLWNVLPGAKQLDCPRSEFDKVPGKLFHAITVASRVLQVQGKGLRPLAAVVESLVLQL